MMFRVPTIVMTLLAVVMTPLVAGIDVVFVTPAYLKSNSVPFIFEVAATDHGSVGVKFTITPSVPFTGQIGCSMVVSTMPLSDAGITTGELFNRITSKMVRREVKYAVSTEPKKSLTKVVYVSKSEAPFTALSVYYPGIEKRGEWYYVLIGAFLDQGANQLPQRNAGAGPAISDEASPPHRAAPSENAARPQPPRG